jgi:hypothetical protein
MSEVLGRLTGTRFEQVLAAAIVAADRRLARARADAARDRQGVWLGRNIEHGYATLVGRAPAADLKSVDVSLDQVAAALTVLGDTDGHDLRRAKALALLASPEAVLDVLRRADEVLEATTDDVNLVGPHDGTAPRRRAADLGDAVLYVHLTDRTLTEATTEDGIARIEGVGPALLGQVREWVGHRRVIVKAVIDIPGMRPVDCYEVPARMAEAIRLRTPASPFPYSANLSLNGDNDHTENYVPMNKGGPPSQTAVDNLAWIPRHPHRLKTHSPWHVAQPRSGAWLWRSPHGFHFLVDEHGTTSLGKL